MYTKFEVNFSMTMIDFACKRVPIEEIIKCSFALAKTDYATFKVLITNNKEMSVQEIQEKVGKDRTTVQRSIKSLLEKNLILRRQINLESGGFMYYYNIRKKQEIKDQIYSNFESWEKKVLDELESW